MRIFARIMRKMKGHRSYGLLHRAVIVLTAAFSAAACSTYDPYEPDGSGSSSFGAGSRVPNQERDNVFIMYSLGFNNISKYLQEDIDDIASGPLPEMFRSEDVVLIFNHSTQGGTYSTKTSPVLTRLYRDGNGDTVRDTLLVFPKGTVSASASTLRTVLTYIKDRFPARRYGMLMSSHATGWIPEGYASDSDGFEKTGGDASLLSFGAQNINSSSAHEIDITDLAAAIPMKFDYIIFDACFMGGVEVAYELRDVCGKLAASQTEILADGMDYRTIFGYLLTEEPDLEGFCRNFYDFYNAQNGIYRSATISLTDCSRLEPLADVCRDIFAAHRDGLAALERSYSSPTLQKYWRSSAHKWFYDLESIIVNAGADASEIAALEEALDGCIIYKAATERFMSEFSIHTHCGLSMYLPFSSRNYLNAFYRELAWNRATALVE